MALGRENVSVARDNSGPNIFRLAGLLGDDNLIRHELLAWRIGSEPFRTYSEPVSLASYLLAFCHAPKPWRHAPQRWSAPVSVWVRRGGQGRRCGSAGAYRPRSFQKFFRVSGARDLARAGIDGPPRIATTL